MWSAPAVRVFVGPASDHFYLEGSSRVRYSTEAIGLAKALLPGKYLLFNGWQEIARQ